MTRSTTSSLKRILLHRRYAVTLIVLIVFAAGVRWVHMNQPIRYDEAYSFNQYASPSLWEGLSNYSEPNNHIFHTVLMHASIELFGPTSWAVRLPVFVFGVLLVPVTYWTGRELLNRRVGILAAGFVAGWPYLIHYSSNARGYMIQGVVFLPMMVLARRLARRFRWAEVLAFAGLGAVGMHTVPTMLYGIAMLGLWMLAVGAFRARPGRRGAGLLRAGVSLAVAGGVMLALTLAMYAPVLLRMGHGQLTGNRFVEPLTIMQLLSWQELGKLVQVWGKWNLYASSTLITGLGVAICLGVVALVSRPGRRDLALLLPCLAVAVASLILYMRRIPPPRVWGFLLPPCLLLISTGLLWALRKLTGYRRDILRFLPPVAAMGIALGLGLWAWQTRLVFDAADTATFHQAEPIYHELTQRMAPQDGLAVACPCDEPLKYYFRRDNALPDGPAEGGRLFVVTLDDEHTIEHVLKEAGYAPSSYGRGEIVATFPGRHAHRIGPDRQFSDATIHVLPPQTP